MRFRIQHFVRPIGASSWVWAWESWPALPWPGHVAGLLFRLPGNGAGSLLLGAGPRRAPEIVLVGIDDARVPASERAPAPPRDYLAGLIRGLRKSGARAIGMDVDLRRPTDAADDRALAAAIVGGPGEPGGQVVLARTLNRGTHNGGRRGLPPLALVRIRRWKESRASPRCPGTRMGYFRRIPLAVLLEGGQFLPSLALAIMAHLGAQSPEALAQALAGPGADRAGSSRVGRTPGKSGGTSPLRFFRDDDWKINFIGPPGAF